VCGVITIVMLIKLSTPAFFLACLLALSACSTDPPTLGPLVYTQRYDKNISTILWPVGAARSNLNDTYAPDFRWRRADSTLDSLSGHIGQVVLINFWATWCGPCTSEMPAIQATANTMGDSLFVIGVAVDNPGNSFNTVQSYVQSNGYSYQFAIDSVFTLYFKYFPTGDFSIPRSCFIDKNGNLITTVIGAEDEARILSYARAAEVK
jgi:thiol-disulfide isomerase/thioredoxin